MKYSELIKILRKNGCKVYAQGGSHEKWYSPITGQTFVMPRHKTQDVPAGTLKSIKKAAGID